MRNIRNHRRALARGTAVAILAAGILSNVTAHAQTAPAPQSYDIPSQSISSALARYSAQTGTSIVYDGALPSGARSGAVRGSLSQQQALGALLSGTGLTYRFGANDSVTILAPSSADAMAGDETTLEAIVLEGGETAGYEAAESSVGTKTDTPLRDVPQSIQVVKRSVMEDQQSNTLTQALQNVSNVQQSNTAGNRAETFVTRGFASNTYAIDGSVLNATGSRPEVNPDLAGIERVEVLKGPASVLYGRGEPGGLINLVTRRPTETPTAEATTQVGSFGFRRAEATASGPLNDDATLTGRITGAAQREEGFVENRQDSERQYISGVLEWNPDEDTRVSLSVDHTHQNQPFDRGLVVDANGEIIGPYDLFLGEEWSMVDSRKTRVALTAEHQMTDWLKLRGVARYDDAYTHDTGIDYQGFDDNDDSLMTRRYSDRIEDMRNLDLQFEGVMTFDTGAIGHTVLAGVQHSRSHMDFWSARSRIAPINVYDPVYGAPMPPATPNNAYVQDIVSSSVYLQDQIDLSDQWKALVGLRYDYFEHEVNQIVGEEEPPFDGGALTWRAGLVYQPTDRLSFYTSYATSFMPQSAVGADNAVLDPEEGWQVEAGLKAELIPDRLSANFSVFHIIKNNVAVPVDEEDYSRITGQQRSRGAELDITGEITDGWQVIASLGYVDAEVTKDSIASVVGNRLVGAPYWSGSLWTTYEFQTGTLEGLKLGAGVTAVGARAGDLEKPFYVDGYYRVDAAVSYKVTENIDFSLIGRNLTNEDYIESTGSDTENRPGAPRNFMAAIKAKF